MHAASDAMCDEVQEQGISFRDGIRERGQELPRHP